MYQARPYVLLVTWILDHWRSTHFLNPIELWIKHEISKFISNDEKGLYEVKFSLLLNHEKEVTKIELTEPKCLDISVIVIIKVEVKKSNIVALERIGLT